MPSPFISPMAKKSLPDLLCSMKYFSLLSWVATDHLITADDEKIKIFGDENQITGKTLVQT